MKKITILFLLILSLTSCKKRYSCRCGTTLFFLNGGGQDFHQSKTVPISEKMTEKQAKAVCDHEKETINDSYTNAFTNNGTRASGIQASTVCTLE